MGVSMRSFAVALTMAMSLAASSANAALVFFNGEPATAFADGLFSQYLSGSKADGFYRDGPPTRAINGYGQNGEFIQFNGPVRLSSLILGRCESCYNSHPATFTVRLYNMQSVLIGSQSITGSSTEQLLTFDQDDVSKVAFTFEGTDGTNPYGDGRDVAWYSVADITYFLTGGVPEPATWVMMIAGFGLVGTAMRRRRAAA